MRVLVLGGLVSGRAATRLARRLGYDVALYDRDPTAVADVAGRVDVMTGEWDPTALEGADLIVTSPGIPESAAPIRDALAGPAPLISELEFAARHTASPYVAITGTNGKTTVTETTAAMLDAGGVSSVAAGNVGVAFSDVALETLGCVAVEASSFQLRFIDTFHPAAAAILNIAPDHLDWHGGFDAYAGAKARIYENQEPGDILVYGADDEAAVMAALGAPGRRIPVSGIRRPAAGNGPVGDRLVVGEHDYPRPDVDAVWLFDLAVSATLANAMGASPDGIAEVLAHFEPGLHRRTIVARSGGVTWVNDSKATNPHAAVAAAGTYDSVVLIAGGRNKGLDLAPLAAVPTVRHIVALGEAAEELAAAGGDRVTVVEDLRTAVAVSAEMAAPGDTVLLAPGCASFDMFDSYAQRGEVFTVLVRECLAVDHGA